MKLGRVGLAFLGATMLTVTGTSGPVMFGAAQAAAQKFSGEKPRASQTATLGDFVLGKKLFRYGERTGDVEAMYNGARIVNQFTRKEGTAVKQRSPGAETAAAPAGTDRSAAAMFSAAKKAAGDDATLAAEIDQAAGEQARSTSGGLDYVDFELAPESIEYLDWDLVRGEYYELAVEGDGRTDVDLEVYDPNGNLVCSSTGDDDIEYCQFRARSSGTYTIVVTNYGTESNWVDLMWWI